MKKMLVLALIIGLAVCGNAYAAVDTADEVDLHSNTVVENLVTGVSDVSDGNTIDVGETGGIYIDGGSVGSGSTSGAVTTGAGVITRATFTGQTNNDYIEIYDGTSRGTYATCLADIQAGVAKVTNNVLMHASFSTGIYVYNNDASSTWQVEYFKSDQGE